MAWLDHVITSLAQRTAVERQSLELTADARRKILDVARVASHASGDRTNAPLLCYVLGTLGRDGVSLDDAIAIVEAAANDQA